MEREAKQDLYQYKLQLDQQANRDKKEMQHHIAIAAQKESIASQSEVLGNERLSAAKDIILFVLTMNVFVFNGSHYHQLWETAMCTRVAPTYACIFMGFLEIAMLGAWTGTKFRM